MPSSLRASRKAWRWLIEPAVFGGVPVRGLVVLAGDVPPDVAPECGPLASRPDWPRHARPVVYRREGEGGPAGSRGGTFVRTHVFQGGHSWDQTFVDRAAQFLDEVTQGARTTEPNVSLQPRGVQP